MPRARGQGLPITVSTGNLLHVITDFFTVNPTSGFTANASATTSSPVKNKKSARDDAAKLQVPGSKTVDYNE